jgi:hypothetical protein
MAGLAVSSGKIIRLIANNGECYFLAVESSTAVQAAGPHAASKK